MSKDEVVEVADGGDPLVRSLDPFTREHLETPDERTVATQTMAQAEHGGDEAGEAAEGLEEK